MINYNNIIFSAHFRPANSVRSVLTNIRNANSACPAQNWAALFRIRNSSASIIRSARSPHVSTRIRRRIQQSPRMRPEPSSLGDGETEEFSVGRH